MWSIRDMFQQPERNQNTKVVFVVPSALIIVIIRVIMYVKVIKEVIVRVQVVVIVVILEKNVKEVKEFRIVIIHVRVRVRIVMVIVAVFVIVKKVKDTRTRTRTRIVIVRVCVAVIVNEVNEVILTYNLNKSLQFSHLNNASHLNSILIVIVFWSIAFANNSSLSLPSIKNSVCLLCDPHTHPFLWCS